MIFCLYVFSFQKATYFCNKTNIYPNYTKTILMHDVIYYVNNLQSNEMTNFSSCFFISYEKTYFPSHYLTNLNLQIYSCT